MGLPKIENYGKYSSANYGKHTLRVDIGELSVWYSYDTPVAFQVSGYPRYVRENDWGPTTGKHLNWIDGGAKYRRVDSATFERLWNETVTNLFPGIQGESGK